MNKCMSCGKTILLGKNIENVIICNNCANLIDYSSWIDRGFASRNELIEKKMEVIKLAKERGIKTNVIEKIENYFDEYINAGFEGSVDGNSGQVINVFSDYCVIKIKNENGRIQVHDICKELVLKKILEEGEEDDEEDDDNEWSIDDKMKLAKSLIRGKAVSTGLSIAISKAVKNTAREEVEELKREKKEKEINKNLNKMFPIGEKTINLNNIKKIDFINENNKKGYLKLIPYDTKEDDIYKNEYFFFKDNIPFMSKNIYSKVYEINKILKEKISTFSEDRKNKIEDNKKINNIEKSDNINKQENEDSFDLIKKYKNLLDEGIITEKEFKQKKKDLLNL